MSQNVKYELSRVRYTNTAVSRISFSNLDNTLPKSHYYFSMTVVSKHKIKVIFALFLNN